MARLRGAWRALRRSWRGPHEIALFAAAYLTYFGVRALTEGGIPRAVVNARDLFRLEHAVRVDWERPAQSVILHSTTLRGAVDAIYIYGHWPVLIVGGVLLFNLARPQYFRLRNVCLLSGAIGLVIFAVFPVAPPRLAGLGFVDTITMHAHGYRTVMPPSLVNEYAAMPSFHAGWNLMLGIALFRATSKLALRMLAAALPLAMGFATVATANHFVLDVLAGCAIVVLSYYLVEHMERGPTLVGDDSHARARGATHPRAVRGRAPRGERHSGAATRRAARRPSRRG